MKKGDSHGSFLFFFKALLNDIVVIVHLRWPHVPQDPTSMKITYLRVSFLGPQEVGHEGVASHCILRRVTAGEGSGVINLRFFAC